MAKSNLYKKNCKDLIGLIPAAGMASRIAPLPCSKEIYPIGFRSAKPGQSLRTKVVCHYLLEKMQIADVTKAYIILRKGKWDIPGYLGDGKIFNMRLAYLMMDLPFGVPYTLDQAYPFLQNAVVVFGFPDIIFEPSDAFKQLLARQVETEADIVLGLFPAQQPNKMDMVDIDKNSRIREIIIKPDRTHLRYSWIIAVWTKAFTDFMHNYVRSNWIAKHKNSIAAAAEHKEELFMGEVIQEAIRIDMRIDAVFFHKGSCLDIGTPEDLLKAKTFIA